MATEVSGVIGGAAVAGAGDQPHARADVVRPRRARGDGGIALQARGRLARASAMARVVGAAESAGDCAVGARSAPGLDRHAKADAGHAGVVERDARHMPVAADAVAAVGAVGVAPQPAIAAGRCQRDASARGGDGAGRQGVVDESAAASVAAPMVRVRIPAIAAASAADVDQNAGLARRVCVDPQIAVPLDEVAQAPLAVVAIVRR
ncbi:hypothetical protein D3C71_1235510 [compost metagenome]